MRTARRLPDGLFSGALVLAALAWVAAPALTPGLVLFERDHGTVFHRMFWQVAQAYREGTLPLWDPASGGGEPLASYSASMFASPLFVLFFLPGSFLTLYDLFILAHLPLAAWSMYRLARELELDARPAALAGLVYGLSGTILSLNNLVPALEAAALGPLALSLALRVVRDPRPLPVALFGITLGFHAQVADPAFFLADVILFVLLARGPASALSTPRMRAAALGRLAAGAVLGAGLAALQIVLLYDLLRTTPRGEGFAYEVISAFSVHPTRLLELFLPGISTGADHAGSLLSVEGEGRHNLISLYAGASVAPLAAVALTSRRARAAIAGAALFVVLMLGRFTPVHGLVVALIPGLASSRYPDKFAYGFSIAWALAAALAVADLEEQRIGRSKIKLVALFLLPAAGVASWLLGAEPEALSGLPRFGLTLEEASDVLARGASHGLVALCLSGLVVIAWLARSRGSAWYPWLLFVIVGGDLAGAARPVLPLAEASIFDLPPIGKAVLADDPRPVVVQYEHFRAPDFLPHPRAAELMRYVLARFGLSSGGMFGARFVFDPDVNHVRPRFWTETAGLIGYLDEPERIRAFGRLGVSHVLVETEARALSSLGLRYVASGETFGGQPISAFRLIEHRPLVSLACCLRAGADLGEALRAGVASRSLEVVGVERADVSGALEALAARTSTRASGRVQDVDGDLTAGRIAGTAEAASSALLVVAQRYDAGWRAEVDGREVQPVRCEGVLMCLPVSEGRHTFTLRYRPPRFGLASGLAAASWLVVLAIFARAISRRRSAGSAGGAPSAAAPSVGR